MDYQIGDSRDRNASTDWLCREDQGGESQHSRLHHFGHAQLYIVAFMPVRYRSNDGPCPSATGRHGCNRLMIDMWLCSITMPLVYARRSIHSYLRARLWPSTRNKLSEIEGTPKRTPGPESRACRYGYFSWNLIVITHSPRPSCIRDDPAHENYNPVDTHVWSKYLMSQTVIIFGIRMT